MVNVLHLTITTYRHMLEYREVRTARLCVGLWSGYPSKRRASYVGPEPIVAILLALTQQIIPDLLDNKKCHIEDVLDVRQTYRSG